MLRIFRYRSYVAKLIEEQSIRSNIKLTDSTSRLREILKQRSAVEYKALVKVVQWVIIYWVICTIPLCVILSVYYYITVSYHISPFSALKNLTPFFFFVFLKKQG